MLSAAPHRGTRTEVASLDRCVLGVSCEGHADEPGQASLATAGGFLVAFAGVLDDVVGPGREGEGNDLTEDLARCPAEVIARLFAGDGSGAVTRLRGAFAAAVTDGEQLWCFRDHVGFGPLFYRAEPGRFLAATEAKQVVEGAGLAREADVDVVVQLFYAEFDDDTPCALKGVQRLPKATILRVGRTGLSTSRYWDPEPFLETGRYAETEIEDAFHHLMGQAVTRMVTGADVVSLSGGIDSPAIAAYAAPRHLEASGEPLYSLTALYPDAPSVDEEPYARLVADRLGIEFHTYESTAPPLADIAYWARVLDSPFYAGAIGDAAEHYRNVRSLGRRTNLGGEMAEFVMDLTRFLVPHLLLHGRYRDAARMLRAQFAQSPASRALAATLRNVVATVAPRSLEAAYLRYRPWHRGARWPAWIDRRRIAEAEVETAHPARRRWIEGQLGAFKGPGLSLEADEICQAVNGVLVRRPWIDIDLWEFFLSLPAEVKHPTPQSKALVRRFLRGRVPDEILDRRDKTIFNEATMRRIDYDVLKQWLDDPVERIPGVDYAKLSERLERGDLSLMEFLWARDLAASHAFMAVGVDG